MKTTDELPTTEYRGHVLVFFKHFDAWGPQAADSPIAMGKLPDVMRDIDRWEVEKQRAEGFPVWNIKHDSPDCWTLSQAVFRRGGEAGLYSRSISVRYVRLRNGLQPDSLYDVERDAIAMDTAEVRTAIEEAKAAHAAAVAASKRWKAAWAKIPRLTIEEWSTLPERKKDL